MTRTLNWLMVAAWLAALWLREPLLVLLALLMSLLAGRERVSYDTLVRNFALGLTGLLAVMVLSSTDQIVVASTLLSILLAFLALGLFVVALASIQEARRYEGARSDHSLPLAHHWWGMVAAVVGALLLVAVLLSRLFLPETLGFLVAWAATLLVFLGQILSSLVLIVSYPIFMVLEWLLRLLLARPLSGPPPQTVLPPSLADQFGALGTRNVALPPGLYTGLQIAGGALAIALIVLVFVRAFRRFHTYSEDDVAETHESILSLDLLRAQLARLLRRNGADSGARPEPFVALNGDEPSVRVRRTYQALLVWAATHGLARAPGVTPTRYQQVLSDAFPSCSIHFETITAAYTCARYGMSPVPEESASAVLAAWQQLLDCAEAEVT